MTDDKHVLLFKDGWYQLATHIPSPFYNERPQQEISALIIHNISLPAGEFGTNYVYDLFLGCLDCNAHPSFNELKQVEVSAHFFINRLGRVAQFVSVDKRAWHAGVSHWKGRDNVNDFSIGIELEGTDDIPYSEQQYQQLSTLTQALVRSYSISLDNIVGHVDIAPLRKTDPGISFDWSRYKQLIKEVA